MLQHSPSETTANIALLRNLLDRAALMITASSPIDVPGIPRYLPLERVITAQWRRTQGTQNGTQHGTQTHALRNLKRLRLSPENPHAAGRTPGDPARHRSSKNTAPPAPTG